MIEKVGDIWDTDCDVIAITTNGDVKNNGELVMGKGIALQAKQRYSDLPEILGELLIDFGNIPEIVHCFNGENKNCIVSLPTKHHWKDKSDIKLIKHSLNIIDYIFDKSKTIALPRPGCANGGLDWETEVKPIIEPLLDDRFIVYSLE